MAGLAAERTGESAYYDAELAAERIAVRRRVLDWRDHWSIEAEVRLRDCGLAAMKDLNQSIVDLPTHKLMTARAGIIDLPVLSGIVEKVNAEAGRVMAAANEALKAIIAYHLTIEANAGKAERRRGVWMDQAFAIGQGAAPLAAAGGLLSMLPTLATTTVPVMFGLATVSAVSLPILVVGAGSAAALGALGVVSLKGLRRTEERKLRAVIEAEMETRLFAPAGGDMAPSLLAQLQSRLADVARQLVEVR